MFSVGMYPGLVTGAIFPCGTTCCVHRTTEWYVCLSSSCDLCQTSVHTCMLLKPKTTISVKIVGTLNCLLTLPMLVYKISLVDSDEQHWEDEETARRMKKQRAMEVSQLFLSETVLEKEFEELLTLSCNSATGLTQL